MDYRDLDLFMACAQMNGQACAPIPEGFFIRSLRESELDIWKRIHFDKPQTAEEYQPYMEEWFEHHYAARRALFFERCQVICDSSDRVLGTCFWWEHEEVIPTLHWFKVIREAEGQGLGRALLTHVMRDIPKGMYPVYLHTQTSSMRAIKLYTDFGFALLDNPRLDERDNGLEESMETFARHMTPQAFANLKVAHYDAGKIVPVKWEKRHE